MIVILPASHSTKQRLPLVIPGHVALTKIKCIPIEYLYPTWDTTTYAQSMMESAVTGGRKNSLPVFIFVNTQSLTVAVSRFHLEKLKYLQDQETNNIYLRKVTTHTTEEYHFSECSMDLLRPCKN